MILNAVFVLENLVELLANKTKIFTPKYVEIKTFRP